MNVVILQLIVPIRFDLEPGEIWGQKVSITGLSPEQARTEKHDSTCLCTTGKKMCWLVEVGNICLTILSLWLTKKNRRSSVYSPIDYSFRVEK